ncbi:AraC family transcriptional regulator [Jiangella ureilytica]|uniref:AraC family transcriptional regulator n=1 Tax=Jiangella ureilytica TaxID=2530374 RepID=A0A4R4S335_9ACTN|nr:helix-turn-helix domain-containing protein [Jiangella ureilytica]TDC56716.1 AraC family transcriptional regulator [Jiangella ureilytica]
MLPTTHDATVQAQWEMSSVRRARLAAGEGLTDAPGSMWALVADGAVAVETATGQRPLSAGDAVFVDARTAFRLVAAEPAVVLVADLRLVVPAHRLPSPLVVTAFSDRHRGVAGLVQSCPIGDGRHPSLFVTSYAGLVGAAMTCSWLEDEPRDDGAGDEQVASVVAALVARPGEPWTLDRMAGLAHLSRSALTDRFRRVTGRSPMQVLRDVRMWEARRLLGVGGQPVTRVAYAVGYGSVAAFSRAFSSWHGVAPHQWRGRSAGRDPEQGEAQPGGDGGSGADDERRRDPVGVQQRAAHGGAERDGHLERGDLQRHR